MTAYQKRKEEREERRKGGRIRKKGSEEEKKEEREGIQGESEEEGRKIINLKFILIDFIN